MSKEIALFRYSTILSDIYFFIEVQFVLLLEKMAYQLVQHIELVQGQNYVIGCEFQNFDRAD